MTSSPRPVPPALVTSREGTGVAFPAALRAHVRERGDAAALAEALAWGASAAVADRLLALEVLGVLVEPRALPPSAAVLGALTEQAGSGAVDEVDDLRWVAAKVLGQAGSRLSAAPGGPAALALLLALTADPAPDVRWQAVSSLPLVSGTTSEGTTSEGATSEGESPVVSALLRAASDGEDDEEVRDQAVFALALQLDVDTPAVRDALAARTGDEREDTAAQATRGLALRGDARALPVLVRRLAVTDPEAVAELDVVWAEAAADLGDPALLGVLQALRAFPDLAADVAEAVDEAITRCSAHR